MDPSRAQIEAHPCRNSADGFDVERFGSTASVIVTPSGAEHFTFNNGHSCLGFDIFAGSVLAGPVTFKVAVSDLSIANRQFATVQRLLALHRNPTVNADVRRSSRNNRIVAALRVSDALSDGASYRQIAVALFGEKRVKDEWAGASDSIRLQVRRLAALARHMAGGGWRTLLQQ